MKKEGTKEGEKMWYFVLRIFYIIWLKKKKDRKKKEEKKLESKYKLSPIFQFFIPLSGWK